VLLLMVMRTALTIIQMVLVILADPFLSLPLVILFWNVLMPLTIRNKMALNLSAYNQSPNEAYENLTPSHRSAAVDFLFYIYIFSVLMIFLTIFFVMVADPFLSLPLVILFWNVLMPLTIRNKMALNLSAYNQAPMVFKTFIPTGPACRQGGRGGG
jgi:hypothetical protein